MTGYPAGDNNHEFKGWPGPRHPTTETAANQAGLVPGDALGAPPGRVRCDRRGYRDRLCGIDRVSRRHPSVAANVAGVDDRRQSSDRRRQQP